LRAEGNEAAALEILRTARERVLQQANAIGDERYRVRFLEAVPENVLVLAAFVE
jgi:hypothetical protein